MRNPQNSRDVLIQLYSVKTKKKYWFTGFYVEKVSTWYRYVYGSEYPIALNENDILIRWKDLPHEIPSFKEEIVLSKFNRYLSNNFKNLLV